MGKKTKITVILIVFVIIELVLGIIGIINNAKFIDDTVHLADNNIQTEGLTLSKTNLTLDLHAGSASLSIDSAPEGTTSFDIKWTSSNENVVKISGSVFASVIPVGVGKATITATVKGLTAICDVEVVKITSITLSKSTLTLEFPPRFGLGRNLEIKEFNSIGNFYSFDTIWMSSDENVVKVEGASSIGVVTPVGVGEATVTATVDGRLTATCNVIVKSSQQPVKGMNFLDEKAEVHVGETYTIGYRLLPADPLPTNKMVIWSSNNSSVASVNNYGVVTAKSAGTAIITGITEDGGYSDTIEIKVVQPTEKEKSGINTLETLTISSGTIKFDPDINKYNITVQNNISAITISSSLTDSKASYVDGYGNRTVNLDVGNNAVFVKVKAENGDLRTYVLSITRDKENITEDYDCQSIFGNLLIFLQTHVFGPIRYLVPLALVILTSIDFSKVIFGSDKEGIKKAQSKFIKRALVALMVFLAPTFVEMLLSLLNNSSIKDCLNSSVIAKL